MQRRFVSSRVSSKNKNSKNQCLMKSEKQSGQKPKNHISEEKESVHQIFSNVQMTQSIIKTRNLDLKSSVKNSLVKQLQLNENNSHNLDEDSSKINKNLVYEVKNPFNSNRSHNIFLKATQAEVNLYEEDDQPNLLTDEINFVMQTNDKKPIITSEGFDYHTQKQRENNLFKVQGVPLRNQSQIYAKLTYQPYNFYPSQFSNNDVPQSPNNKKMSMINNPFINRSNSQQYLQERCSYNKLFGGDLSQIIEQDNELNRTRTLSPNFFTSSNSKQLFKKKDDQKKNLKTQKVECNIFQRRQKQNFSTVQGSHCQFIKDLSLNKLNYVQKLKKFEEDFVQNQQNQENLYNKANQDFENTIKQKSKQNSKSKVPYNELLKSKKNKQQKLKIIKEQKMDIKNQKDFQRFQNLNEYIYAQKIIQSSNSITNISFMIGQMRQMVGFGTIHSTLDFLNQYIEELTDLLKTARVQRRKAIKNMKQSQCNQVKQRKQIQQYIEQNKLLQEQIYKLKAELSARNENSHSEDQIQEQFNSTSFTDQITLIHSRLMPMLKENINSQTRFLNEGIQKIHEFQQMDSIITTNKISESLIIGRLVAQKYLQLNQTHNRCPSNLVYREFLNIMDNEEQNQLSEYSTFSKILKKLNSQILRPQNVYEMVIKKSGDNIWQRDYLVLEYKYILLCSFISQSFLYSTFSTSVWMENCRYFQDELNYFLYTKAININKNVIIAQKVFFQSFTKWQKRKAAYIFNLILNR